MGMEQKLEFVNEKFLNAFHQFGHSPKSLLWKTDRQNMRFYELLKYFHIRDDSTILDVGCGFADLYKFCTKHLGVKPQYTGIDYCSEFIKTMRNEQPQKCIFVEGNFLTVSDLSAHDFCVASGIFNVFNYDNYSGDTDDKFLRSVVGKMFALCKVGVSFNFITDKVDFKKKGITYYSPARILDFCYSMSCNVIYDNTCMPFEATVTIFKDDSFNETRVFNSFMRNHAPSVQNGLLSGEFQ